MGRTLEERTKHEKLPQSYSRVRFLMMQCAVFTGQGQARTSPLARRRERGNFVVEDFDIIEVSSMNIVTSNSEQFVKSWKSLPLGRRVRSTYPFVPPKR